MEAPSTKRPTDMAMPTTLRAVRTGCRTSSRVTMRNDGEMTKRIRQLEEKMYQLARDLEFEAAAQLRDEIGKLRERLLTV